MVETVRNLDLKDQLADNIVDTKEIKQLDDFIKAGKYKEKPIGPVDLLGYGVNGDKKAKALAQSIDKILDDKNLSKEMFDNILSFYSGFANMIKSASTNINYEGSAIPKSSIPNGSISQYLASDIYESKKFARLESNTKNLNSVVVENWSNIVQSIDAKVASHKLNLYPKWLQNYSLNQGSVSNFEATFDQLKKTVGATPDASMKTFLDDMSLKEKSLYEQQLSSLVLSNSTLNGFLALRNQYKSKYLDKKNPDSQVQDILNTMQTKEIAFYKDQIKESWNKDISFDGYLNLQPLLDDFKKTISNIQDQTLLDLEAGKYEGKTLASYYSLIDKTNINAKPYPKDAQQKIDDILANENRISLGLNFVSALNTYSAEFKNPKDIAFLKTKFEEVIRSTSDPVVNTLMKEICTLTDPQADRVFHNIALKFLKDKNTDKDNRITSFASVIPVVRDLATSPNPASSEEATNRTLNKSFFDNVKAPEVVDISDKDVTAKVLNTLAKFKIDNPNIQETIISCPKSATTNWYGSLLVACQSKYPNLKNIKIQEVDGTTDISIKTIEKTIKTEPIKIKFDALDPNVVADKNEFQKALSENIDMKELITNPNWKIIGGTFTGSASRSSNTNYPKSPMQDIYTNDSHLSFINTTEGQVSELDQNNSNLAFDRAIRLYDIFATMPGKIKLANNNKINISYAVAGPTVETMPDEFKQYQNSSVDLVLEKTDFNEQQDSFTTVKTQAKDLALNIKNEETTWSKIIRGGGTAIQTIGGSIGSIFTFGGDGLQHPRHKGGCMCNYN